MPDVTQCPDCGAEIPSGHTKGLCPRCALKGALELADDDSGSTATMPVVPQTGERIGRYKLLEKIGEGGFGIVYMAEQEEPVRRRVALKVIKPGMDTREVIARFEAERQALALMEHPHIAKVFDGGATESGRPYFVMELVRGLRITDYCDQKNLSTRQRLDLFMQVCQAVQHAHQKGVIHRDLKPSNILVTVNDGIAIPKVIDFGIAKATGQRLTDKTLFTRFQQLLGTPAYMSPEQAEMTSVDVDTRSDIYSLGVLLYELLTGRTPFDGNELLRAGMEEMLRTIREREPVRPSVRLGTLAADEQTTVAKQRQTDSPKLFRLLRGDLDWIAMKCLEKDRARRYETASGLATDVQRHFDQEPVLARSPTTADRMQKFVRRNKGLVAASVVIVSVLILDAVVSVWQAMRATQAEREQSRLRADAEMAAIRIDEQRLRTVEADALLVDVLETFNIRDSLDEHWKLEFAFGSGPHVTGVVLLLGSLRILVETPNSNGTSTGSVKHSIETTSLRDRLVFDNSDGSRAFVRWLSENILEVCELNQGKPLYAGLQHEGAVTWADFSSNGKLLLTVSSNGLTKLFATHIWDTLTGRQLVKLPHRSSLRRAMLHPDGGRVITTSAEGEAFIWNLLDPAKPERVVRDQHPFLSARFSRNGRRIITLALDGRVKLWDSATYKPLNGAQ